MDNSLQKEYIVILTDDSSKPLSSLHEDLCCSGSNNTIIPNRIVKCSNKRPGSIYQTNYILSETEAEILKSDERVSDVVLTDKEFPGFNLPFGKRSGLYIKSLLGSFGYGPGARLPNRIGVVVSGTNGDKSYLDFLSLSTSPSGYRRYDFTVSATPQYDSAKFKHSYIKNVYDIRNHRPHGNLNSPETTGTFLSGAPALSGRYQSVLAHNSNQGVTFDPTNPKSKTPYNYSTALSSRLKSFHLSSELTWDSSLSTSSSANRFFSMDGTGVDVIIQDTGIDATSPEWEDSNGVSRLQIVDWYSTDVCGGQISAYTKPNGWTVSGHYRDTHGHGTHVAGTCVGKTFGWATNARIYSQQIYLGQNDGLKNSLPIEDAMDMIKLFHLNKPVDANTGYRRPTIVNQSWGSTYFIMNGDGTPLGNDVAWIKQRIPKNNSLSVDLSSITTNYFKSNSPYSYKSDTTPSGHEQNKTKIAHNTLSAFYVTSGKYLPRYITSGSGDPVTKLKPNPTSAKAYLPWQNTSPNRGANADQWFNSTDNHPLKINKARVTNVHFNGKMYYDTISGVGSHPTSTPPSVLSTSLSSTQIVSMPVSAFMGSRVPFYKTAEDYELDIRNDGDVRFDNLEEFFLGSGTRRSNFINAISILDIFTGKTSLFESKRNDDTLQNNIINRFGFKFKRITLLPSQTLRRQRDYALLGPGNNTSTNMAIKEAIDVGVHFVKAAGNSREYIANHEHPNYDNYIGLPHTSGAPTVLPVNDSYVNWQYSSSHAGSAYRPIFYPNVFKGSRTANQSQYFHRGSTPSDANRERRDITVGALACGGQTEPGFYYSYDKYYVKPLKDLGKKLRFHDSFNNNYPNLVEQASDFSFFDFWDLRNLYYQPWVRDNYINKFTNNGKATESPASFSNKGPGIDIYAQGEGVLSVLARESYRHRFYKSNKIQEYNESGVLGPNQVYANYYHPVDGLVNTNYYVEVMNGTSMACPQVAGVGALYLQAHPEYSPEMLKKVMMNDAVTGTMVSGNSSQGFGVTVSDIPDGLFNIVRKREGKFVSEILGDNFHAKDGEQYSFLNNMSLYMTTMTPMNAPLSAGRVLYNRYNGFRAMKVDSLKGFYNIEAEGRKPAYIVSREQAESIPSSAGSKSLQISSFLTNDLSAVEPPSYHYKFTS